MNGWVKFLLQKKFSVGVAKKICFDEMMKHSA